MLEYKKMREKYEEYNQKHQEKAEEYIVEGTNITSGLELWGRKKGKFYWYPFDREIAFNNNVAVVEGDQGASNDGLRLMRKLANSVVQQKDSVCILDSGRNFTNQVQRLNKEYITLGDNNQLCINPFSALNGIDNDFVQDALSLIALLIDAMVSRPEERVQEDEEGGCEIKYLIELGLKEIWKRKKHKVGMDDLIEWMLQSDKGLGKDREYIANKLAEYGSEGKYGKYFNGEANIKLDNIFHAISFEGLEGKRRKVLTAGILTYINIYDIAQRFRNAKNKKSIIIKDLIGDFKNKEEKIFVEVCLRIQRLDNKGIILNINPNSEIFNIFNKGCDTICCTSNDEKAIESLAETSFVWASVKGMMRSSSKYPEYLIQGNQMLRGGLEERG